MAIDEHQTSLGLEETVTSRADDAERDRIRAEYRARLAEKLKDPAFRRIEGFPIGTDEAILALSDPPYYTACPNPFIAEWLAEHGKPYDAATDDYHREPFAADVSEGKNDPIYNAHSYHTKVPHKAIMRYILHYTEPGDVVYDGFCGTGMAGVAAQMCGHGVQVESLGHAVRSDGTILDEEGKPFSKLGARNTLLNDLSPAATFIAYNYNTPVDAVAFEQEARRILKEVEDECGWMYAALHDASPTETERIAEAIRACRTADELRVLVSQLSSSNSPLRDPKSKLQVGRINYTVWSDVVICPSCGGEIVFWDVAFNEATGKAAEAFACPSCRAETRKDRCQRATVTFYDLIIQKPVAQPRQVPVLVNFTVGKHRIERPPSDVDRAVVSVVETIPIHDPFPTNELPIKEMYHGSRLAPKGVTHIHHFHSPRARRALSALWRSVNQAPTERLKRFLLFLVEQTIWGLSKLNRYSATHYSQSNIYLNGVYYIAARHSETTPWYILDGKLGRLAKAFAAYRADERRTRVSTSTCTVPLAPPNSVDYLFTDPPFGENIYYADLNYLVESWHRVLTDSKPEAIVDHAKKKGLSNYQELMTTCFRAYLTALKPGRWMTVVFSNSSNAVWNAIQESLERVGFIVADIRVLDKQRGSYRQVSAASTVKEDLVISCYKPRRDFEERFQRLQGQPEGVIEFVRQHLDMLPVVPVNKAGRLETVAERTRFLLFDRMVAYHLQHAARIPVSAAAFYKLLDDQFLERDEMYFLPEQAARYDALKGRGMETEQFSLFVRDEKSAIQWVRARLNEEAQTLGDLTPAFMQELREWPAHEPRPELRVLLREYFIEDGGTWRVPDPDNERDLEALRRAALLKMFREYASAKGPLKTFRTEAVLEGFRYCWETKQYGIVVQVCEKIPAKVLQEVHDLVQFYDIAKDLAPERMDQLEFTWE